MRISLLLLCLAAFSLWAQKVAYVNMETVFNEYYKTANENIRFEEERQNFLTGLEVLRTEFESTRKEFNDARGMAQNVLVGEENQKAAAQKAEALGARLAQKEEEIIRYQQQARAEIEERQQSATNRLLEELQAQLEKYAAEKGYEMVYEVSGRTLNRVRVLLVYPKDKEITEAMVKLVNAGHEAEKAEADGKLEKMRKAQEAKMKQEAARQAPAAP
ncbi:MAG: OmpH family outer membrane protein [Oligosphaeraceae bacterium]